MIIKSISLPTDINIQLTDYANDVLHSPVRYIDNIRSNRHVKDTIDHYSSNVPGISDEFILNKDLSSLTWGNASLETCLYSKLHYISLPPFEVAVLLIKFLEDIVGKKIAQPSGSFLYPIDGYMGWHTNSNSPGIRAYVVYNQHEHGSYFKYVDTSSGNPVIVTDWDICGWNVRIFNIPEHNYFWHCVNVINSPRISFGYKFK